MKLFLKRSWRAFLCLLVTETLTPPLLADALDDAIEFSRQAEAAPLVSRGVMLQQQLIRDVQLAPDASAIAYILRRGNARELWVHNIDANKHRKVFASKLMEAVRWSSDSKYLFLTSEQGVAVAPIDGSSGPGFIVNLDEARDETFYGVEAGHPHAVLVSLRSETDGHVLFRVLADGSRRELYRSENRPVDFLLDADQRVRFLAYVNDHQFEIVQVKNGEETPLYTCAFQDLCDLFGFDAGAGTLFLQGRFEHDRAALFSLDVSTGVRTVLHSDPKDYADLASVTMNAERTAPVLATYLDDYISSYGLDAHVEATVASIREKVGQPFLALRPSADLSRWLVLDAGPGHADVDYYLYDARTDKLTRPLATVKAEQGASHNRIGRDQTAIRVPIRYLASDGMQLQGYVTLPRGEDPSQVPLVVMPHGGPWNRTQGSYNGRAQFLANRGYAVFEPNFRGSTGFGRHYTLSANRDFGDGRVHQDIMDGMHYVLARGVGDPKRLGIFGHSFGGFSALGGLAFTPDLFQVGVAGAPPADMVDAIKGSEKLERTIEWQLRYANFKQLTVDPDDPADVERLSSQSPDRHSDKIVRPLYIWAGERDRRVSILHVRKFALHLHHAGKPLSLMVAPKAGHGPRGELEREAYFYMLEKAFAEHLGGRMDMSMSPALSRYLKRTMVFDRNNLLDG